MTSGLTAALDEYVDALRKHAASIEEQADQKTVDAVSTLLEEKRREWQGLVFENAGEIEYPLGSDDDDFDDDEDEDDEDEDDDTAFIADPTHKRVSVTARFDFVVTDPDAFITYGRSRLLEDCPDCDEETLEDHAGAPVAALDTLFNLDSWNRDAYEQHGLKDGGSFWSVGPIKKALWEMSDEEREEAERPLGGGWEP